MNDLIPDGKEIGGGSPNWSQTSCCQPADGNGSSCCNPPGGSWGKAKTLISLIVIIVAIGVGAHSLVKGASTQTEVSKPVSNCSPQCGAASCQSVASKPGSSCLPQCGPASSQSEASKPAASCPNPSQCGATN